MWLHAGVIDPGRQSATLLTEDREIKRWLLASGGVSVPEGVREHVERRVMTPVNNGPIILQNHPSLCPSCMAKDATVRDAHFWGLSDGDAIVNLNNSYNDANVVAGAASSRS